MIICEYKHGLRVAICTSNFISIDWARKSQAVWIRDVPLKSATTTTTTTTTATASSSSSGSSSGFCQFEVDLLHYLQESYNNKNRRASKRCFDDWTFISKYDFSSIRAVLLPSVPGYHRGSAMHRFGHMKVRRSLQNVPIPSRFKGSQQAPPRIVAQFSSFGSVTEAYLRELERSFAPDTSAFVAASQFFAPRNKPNQQGVQLQLVWPTVEGDAELPACAACY